MLLQLTAPTVLIGLVLFAVCLVSAWSVNHLQTRLASILSQNVTSMEAAHDLEIALRKLRFHCFRYLLESESKRVDSTLYRDLLADDHAFQLALAAAERSAYTAQETEYICEIHSAYQRYQQQFRELSKTPPALQPNYEELAGLNPVAPVMDPCERYVDANKQQMNQARRDSERVSLLLCMVLLLLGLAGPASGLLIGWSMARGLSRSLRSLSVRIQGMAHQLDQEAGAVRIIPGGDTDNLDRQLEHVLHRVQDIVKQLQAQQAELFRAQQLSALGQLAASVAHEVRNPLMSIKMLVEAALRPNNPRPFTHDNLRVVHGAVLRLEKRVQGFLDFARPPALQRGIHDLRLVVSEALDLVRPRADQQKVEMSVVGPVQPVLGDVDRTQLGAVLVNLCLNSLDAMPSGGHIELRLNAEEKHLVLSILDTGSGIGAEALKTLFTPFASSKPTGTGLGLCISKRIVEDHGGRLTGGNRPEGGAYFTITLPNLNKEATTIT